MLDDDFWACCIPAERPEGRVDMFMDSKVCLPFVVWETMQKGKRTLRLATGDMTSSVEICRYLQNLMLQSFHDPTRSGALCIFQQASKYSTQS